MQWITSQLPQSAPMVLGNASQLPPSPQPKLPLGVVHFGSSVGAPGLDSVQAGCTVKQLSGPTFVHGSPHRSVPLVVFVHSAGGASHG